MRQLFQLKAAARQRGRCCIFNVQFLLLALAMGVFSTASADEAKEASCRHIGANAQAIAVARDQGMSLDEAMAAVRKASRTRDEKKIKEAADLLFHHFRLMTPDAAAFEFYMDCLDSD